MKETFIKKDMPNTVSSISMEDIYKAVDSTQDAKEKALSDSVKMLYSLDKLLMTSRLSKDLAFYIVKHIIIQEFYFNYYTESSCSIKYIQISEYPFIKIDSNIKRPAKDKIKLSYANFLEKLLQITISFEGKGREELIEIIRSLKADVEEEQKNFSGLLKKFY